MINQQIEEIVSLAKEVESEDPIDWGMLTIDENAAYRLVAAGVSETFKRPLDSDKQLAVLATMTKLIVENMVLNIKLLQK